MSKYTEVNVVVTGQAIQLASNPQIASGGVNSVRVNFTFCEMWDGMGKTAVFYKDSKQAYKVPLVDDSAVVPSEVLREDGVFSFGIFGANEDQVFPSILVELKICKGAASIQSVDPAEPTPDIYQQLMAAYGKQEAALAVQRARIDELAAMRSADGASETDIWGEGGITGTITTNGVIARISLEGVLSISASGQTVYSEIIPARFAPLSSADVQCTIPGVRARIGVLADDSEYVKLFFFNDTGDAIEDYVEVHGTYPLAAISVPELHDIRVGVDGTVYPTAGEAVRAQIEAAKRSIAGNGTPTPLTAGGVGMLYMDANTGALYKCIGEATVPGSSPPLIAYDWKYIPETRLGTAAPTSKTFGIVGDSYMNRVAGDLYKCVAAANGVYSWRLVAANGSQDETYLQEIGKISDALDRIIALQEELIGT